MSIGTNIKRRRFELGITQDELAKRLGYSSRSTIAKIESDENGIPASKLLEFARVLDTTVDSLVNSYGVPFIETPSKVNNSSSKTVSVILAGGKSTRNLQNVPNQFINVLGKPVIMYVMDTYEKHPGIDEIYVVCLKGWEDILKSYIKQYHISKFVDIIPSGKTGMLSIKNSITYLKTHLNPNDKVIFQESTRPLVTEEMITKLLIGYNNFGSSVIGKPMTEHVQFLKSEYSTKYISREEVMDLQSPDLYNYKYLCDLFNEGEKMGHSFDESCLSMYLCNLGIEPHFVTSNQSNIKIVRQEDIAIFTALVKMKENK